MPLMPVEICGGLRKSPKSVPRPSADVRVWSASRRRSACARAACTIRETGYAHETQSGPALLSRSSVRLDVQPHSGRSLPTLQSAADGAAGHVGELVRERNRRVRGALVHRASRRTTAARPDTKRSVLSKNCVENHIRLKTAQKLGLSLSGLKTPRYLKITAAFQQLLQPIGDVVPQPAHSNQSGS
eukprot:CAMPEP_0115884804 /NCGR_PEP_ID=MMETSP0287-20121206/30322_1 /TAXON_ID=412157 /ORGANISM="Chrysochromulina rotalis, Strain UIO044" /LENGTH=185 /DNA_ID=CAMNT_0003341151 /DNA_START=32 /DNA_END=590 /DNA_ORIENTATION=-